MTVTASQVESTLHEYFGEEDFSWVEVFYEVPEEGITKDGITVYHVESTGGEGQGDQATIILRAIDGDLVSQYFRKEGYYASYGGFTWDGDLYEVTPQEKTITVYVTETNKPSSFTAEDWDLFDDEQDSFQ